MNIFKRTLVSVLFSASLISGLGLLSLTAHAATQPTVDKPSSSEKNIAKINVNKADAKTLAISLTGVGLAKADAIVSYRESHGFFQTLDDVTNVKGIGPSIVEKNKDKIVF